jgi:hypothetical protein
VNAREPAPSWLLAKLTAIQLGRDKASSGRRLSSQCDTLVVVGDWIRYDH